MLQFNKCTFQTFVAKEGQHPLLYVGLTGIKHLSLTNQSLGDSVFDALWDKTVMLESIGISFNRFTPEASLKYLKKITDSVHDEDRGVIKLKSISVAGNSLDVFQYENKQALKNVLPRLVTCPDM